jgi:hypothetical protein
MGLKANHKRQKMLLLIIPDHLQASALGFDFAGLMGPIPLLVTPFRCFRRRTLLLRYRVVLLWYPHPRVQWRQSQLSWSTHAACESAPFAWWKTC